jgi:dTMP kinase
MIDGKFITLEGIEGAGKSSCMVVIKELLEHAGHDVLVTREPGGTPLGEDLRELLLGHKHTGMADDTELMLMFAARLEHLRNKIEPAIQSGQWVLCDRFTDATYAYQGGGRGLNIHRIEQLENWVQQGIKPDLTLLLDLPVATGLERAGKRSAPDRIESETSGFFQRVRDAYLAIAAAEPERVKVIDASRNFSEVTAQLAEQLGKLPNKPPGDGVDG